VPRYTFAMNLATGLLRALADHGAREIFGIPGDFAMAFFRVIEESAILTLYTLSHEPGVGFAADAAARARPGLGVAAVTYGAGALNMVNAVAAAFAEKSPVVVISGAPAATKAIAACCSTTRRRRSGRSSRSTAR
jgi:indolepyruvate decarboxylase